MIVSLPTAPASVSATSTTAARDPRSTAALPKSEPLEVGLGAAPAKTDVAPKKLLTSAERFAYARRLLDVEAPYQDRLAKQHATRASELRAQGKPDAAAKEDAIAAKHKENAKTQRRAAATQLALEASGAERQVRAGFASPHLTARAAAAHTTCARALVETTDPKDEVLGPEHAAAKEHLDRAVAIDPRVQTKPEYLGVEWRWAATGKEWAADKPTERRLEVTATHVLLGNTVRRLEVASPLQRPELKAQAQGLSLELAQWRDDALRAKQGHSLVKTTDAMAKQLHALEGDRTRTLAELDALTEQNEDILGQANRPFASQRAKDKAAAYHERVRSLRAELDDLKVAARDVREALTALRATEKDAVAAADRADVTLGALTDLAGGGTRLPTAKELLAPGLDTVGATPSAALDAVFLASAARLSDDGALAQRAARSGAAYDGATQALIGAEIAVLDPKAAGTLFTSAQAAVDALPAGAVKDAQMTLLRDAAVQRTLALAARPQQRGRDGVVDNATSDALAFATTIAAEDPRLSDLRALPVRLDRSLAAADARVDVLSERAKANAKWSEIGAADAAESLVSVIADAVLPSAVLPSAEERAGVYRERLGEIDASIGRADKAQHATIADVRAHLRAANDKGTFSLAVGTLMTSDGPATRDPLLSGYFARGQLVAPRFDAHVRAARYANDTQQAKVDQSEILLRDMYYDQDGTRSALMTYGPLGVQAGELLATTIATGGVLSLAEGTAALAKLKTAYATIAELLAPLGGFGSRVAQGFVVLGAQQGLGAVGDSLWSRDAAAGRAFSLATGAVGQTGLNKVGRLNALAQSLALPTLQMTIDAIVIPELHLSESDQKTARLLLTLAMPVLAALHGHAASKREVHVREACAALNDRLPPAERLSPSKLEALTKRAAVLVFGEPAPLPPFEKEAQIALEAGTRRVRFTPDEDIAGNETYRMFIEVKSPDDAAVVFDELLANFKKQTGFELLALTDTKRKFSTGAVEGLLVQENGRTELRVHFKHALDGDVGGEMYRALVGKVSVAAD